MGLLDIAPPEATAKQIEIRGGTLTYRGIKNREWVVLLDRFPEIRNLLNGQGMNLMEVYSTAVEGLIPAVIATGLGNCGDKDTEVLIADRLTEAEQFALFEAIMDIGAAEKIEARNKINPLLQSPQTGGQETGQLPLVPNGEDRGMTSMQGQLSL